MTRIVFLVSGGGGNLKCLHELIRSGQLDWELGVIADRPCGALDFARAQGLDAQLIDYQRTRPMALRTALAARPADAIVTNWHKIIDAGTVAAFDGRLINLHYALLPAFAGLLGMEPVKQAYELGCRWIGATCHLVTADVDAGPILAQEAFRTDIPLDRAIDRMFRLGCSCLLAGLLERLGVADGAAGPGQLIDADDAAFWQTVATL